MLLKFTSFNISLPNIAPLQNSILALIMTDNVMKLTHPYCFCLTNLEVMFREIHYANRVRRHHYTSEFQRIAFFIRSVFKELCCGLDRGNRRLIMVFWRKSIPLVALVKTTRKIILSKTCVFPPFLDRVKERKSWVS